jgi:hypothetical protein
VICTSSMRDPPQANPNSKLQYSKSQTRTNASSVVEAQKSQKQQTEPDLCVFFVTHNPRAARLSLLVAGCLITTNGARLRDPRATTLRCGLHGSMQKMPMEPPVCPWCCAMPCTVGASESQNGHPKGATPIVVFKCESTRRKFLVPTSVTILCSRQVLRSCTRGTQPAQVLSAKTTRLP